MARSGILLFLLSGLLCACNSIIGGAEHTGTFTANATGAMTAALEGRAVAEKQSATVAEGYVIGLVASDGRRIYFYSRSKPGVGTHPVVPFAIETPERGFTAAFFSEPNGGIFNSTAGEVRITSSGRSGLAGSFEAAFEESPGSPKVIHISGSFTTR